MPKVPRLLLSLLLVAATLGMGAFSARSQDGITARHLRAAQLGLLQDFSVLPPEPDVKQRLQAAPIIRSRVDVPGIPIESKMLQGQPVDFRDVVKIKFDIGGRGDFCTGYLVSRHDEPTRRIDPGEIVPVLTAGHCSCGPPSSYLIVRGSVAEQNEKATQFELAMLPSRFDGYSCLLAPEYQSGRDLAILWIRKRDDKAIEINIPQRFPLVGTMHQVFRDAATRWLVGVGYGLTETAQIPSTTLAAPLPIQSHFCSRGFYAASVCASFREFVLADSRPGANRADTCGGDSGGPVFWVPPSEEKLEAKTTRFLVGITSRALAGVRHNPGTLCGGGGIYTAVGHPDVVRWLSAHNVFPRSGVM